MKERLEIEIPSPGFLKMTDVTGCDCYIRISMIVGMRMSYYETYEDAFAIHTAHGVTYGAFRGYDVADVMARIT